eukprot:Rhum_TRINITY_DN2326_c0_g1::Rhum_TRINITY_DN2326_c0_g1_i1::g.6930::m.6930
MIRRETYVQAYTFATWVAFGATWVFGLQRKGARYAYAAYDDMGFPMLALLNLFVWVVSAWWVAVLGPFSQADLAGLRLRLHPAGCCVLVITFLHLDPRTHDEFVLWLVWTVCSWSIVFLSSLCLVRSEAMLQMASVPAREVRRFLLTAASSAVAASVHLVCAYSLFGSAPWPHLLFVLEDPLSCLLTTARCVGQYASQRSAADGAHGVVDVDARMRLVHRATTLPHEVLAFVTACGVLRNLQTPHVVRFVSSVAASSASTNLYRLCVDCARDAWLLSKASSMPLPDVLEFRRYHDPCAICYGIMCLNLDAPGQRRLQTVDAAAAAAAVVAALAAAEGDELSDEAVGTASPAAAASAPFAPPSPLHTPQASAAEALDQASSAAGEEQGFPAAVVGDARDGCLTGSRLLGLAERSPSERCLGEDDAQAGGSEADADSSVGAAGTSSEASETWSTATSHLRTPGEADVPPGVPPPLSEAEEDDRSRASTSSGGGRMDNHFVPVSERSVPYTLTPRVLPCGHMFHMGCLQRWLQRKEECPLCKRQL